MNSACWRSAAVAAKTGVRTRAPKKEHRHAAFRNAVALQYRETAPGQMGLERVAALFGVGVAWPPEPRAGRFDFVPRDRRRARARPAGPPPAPPPPPLFFFPKKGKTPPPPGGPVFFSRQKSPSNCIGVSDFSAVDYRHHAAPALALSSSPPTPAPPRRLSLSAGRESPARDRSSARQDHPQFRAIPGRPRPRGRRRTA